VCDGNGACVPGTPVDCGICQKCDEESSQHCVADTSQDGDSCGVDQFICANGTCVCPTGLQSCNGVCHECCSATQCPSGRPICSDNVCQECAGNDDCPTGEPICSSGTCICHGSGQSCTAGGSPTGCCSGRLCNGGTCCTASGEECAGEHECCPGTGCILDDDFIKRCH
jgi:hypothetical protein